MNIAKTLSTLSLALALQGGALVAATVALSPSDATAKMMPGPKPKPKQDPRKHWKDSRKCIPSRTKACLF